MGRHCKHMIFVKHRVLKIPKNNPLIWNKFLISDELSQILKKTSFSQRYVAPEIIRQVFASDTQRDIVLETKSKDPVPEPEPPKVQRKPFDGEDCLICYEQMSESSGEKLVYCHLQCGNNMHASCLEKWFIYQKDKFVTPSCPYCRVEWEKPSSHSESRSFYTSASLYRRMPNYSALLARSTQDG